ncbi:MAG: hypothetical protein K8S56_00970, partial [Candidatus Cloacimonetes bacterium]|nr:hypothetical protein [Candidatus Cloacimonadota bacterium]
PFFVDMLHRFELWFVPMINPEGYRIVSSGQWEWKRKNNSHNYGEFNLREDGVDLNKNYPVNWKYDRTTNPDSRYYKGVSPGSESEVQTMMHFFERERFQYAVFYHSSQYGRDSERIYFPWCWGRWLSPDYAQMREIADSLASVLPRDYLLCNYEVYTGENNRKGYARDYIYAFYNTLAFTIEAGGNNSAGMGVIHPPDSIRVKILAKHYNMYRVLLQEAAQRLFAFRLVDRKGAAVVGYPVQLKDTRLPQPLRTNADGFFFRNITPGQKYIDLKIGGRNYRVRVDRKRKFKQLRLRKQDTYVISVNQEKT